MVSGVAGRRLGAKLRFWRSPGGEAEANAMMANAMMANAMANDGRTSECFSP